MGIVRGDLDGMPEMDRRILPVPLSQEELAEIHVRSIVRRASGQNGSKAVGSSR